MKVFSLSRGPEGIASILTLGGEGQKFSLFFDPVSKELGVEHVRAVALNEVASQQLYHKLILNVCKHVHLFHIRIVS